MASLEQQHAELAEQRREVEAQRRAIQNLIANRACIMKHAVDKDTSGLTDEAQQPFS